MPGSRGAKRESTRSSARTELTEDGSLAIQTEDTQTRAKREATVYDAVAGKIGLNGFLTGEQLASTNILPSYPEEVLLRRVGAPDEIPYGFYDADQKLSEEIKLPDSDLLKAIHTYTSDYFAATTVERGHKDFRTFDGSALLALGVLLEEASKEVLGETGDMVLVEPEGLENGLQESESTKRQIVGRVKPRQAQRRLSQPEDSDEVEEESRARKRRRHGF